jgi:fucose permease
VVDNMTYILLTLIYIAFISLGLPDSLLGSAWPTMQEGFGVPLSYASYISMLMSVGTVIASLMSDRLTRRFGTGKVTAFSVALTAVSLFGYSVSRSYVLLLIDNLIINQLQIYCNRKFKKYCNSILCN